MTRLIDAVRAIAREATPTAKQPTPTGPFFERGEVVNVDGNGVLTVKIGTQTVSARPVTDEPFTAKMMVWVSASSDGYIVHGGIR
jgi:hypothetical protein